MPRDQQLAAEDETRAEGYRRAWDVATARAESRMDLGLPLEYGVDHDFLPIEDDA